MTDNAQVVPAALTPASLPPYGELPAEFYTSITNNPPPSWPGSEADFITWYNSVVALLAKLFWPRYVNRDWASGDDAYNYMVRLTQADFALLAAPPAGPAATTSVARGGPPSSARWIHGSNETTTVGPIMTAPAPASGKSSWVAALAPNTLFNQEDVTYAVVNTQTPGAMHANRVIETLGFSRTFRSYMDGALPPALIDQFGRLYDALCLSNDYSFVLRMKDQLQRPRAYQMAKIFGIDNFQHNQAVSSVTPSIPNGHAFQSAIYGSRMACAIQLHASTPQAMAAMPILKQHTADIGDRRVQAHVHYPSDSLASWIVALLLQSELPTPEDPVALGAGFANTFLADAIINFSHNYAAIAKAAAADNASRYSRPLNIIQYFVHHPTAKVGDITNQFG